MDGHWRGLRFFGRSNRKTASRIALACSLALASASAQAINVTWDGGGSTNAWFDAGNWSGALPAPANDAFIGSGFASGTALVLTAPSTINSLTINTITGFTIGRNVINSGIFLALDSGNLTRQNVSGTEADQFLDIDVVLGANGTWNVAGSNELTVRGYISEFANTDVNLTKTGTGTLVLNRQAQFGLLTPYDGSTSLNQGRIRLAGYGGIGEGTVTVADGATLELQTLVSGQDSALRLSGFGVSLFPLPGSDGALKNVAGNNAWTGLITLLDDAGVNVEGGSLTLSGGIADGAGTFQLSKFGSGDLTLSGAATHGGGVAVTSGRLIITNGSALGVGTSSVGINGILGIKGGISVSSSILLNGVNLGGTATLQNLEDNNTISGSITLVGNSAISAAADTTLTLSGLITDNGAARSLTKQGDGILNLNHTNSFTGGLNVQEGTVRISLATAITTATTTTVSAGASLEVPNNVTVTRLVQLNGNGFGGRGALYGIGNSGWNGGITLQSNTSIGAEGAGVFLIAGSISGGFALSKVGDGTLQLTNAANSFGNLNINEGILLIAGASGIPAGSALAVTAINAALELSGNITLNRPLSLKADGVNGTGALRNIGGNNTWLGPVSLPAPALISVEGGSQLLLSGAISGTGGLAKVGPGLLTLNGSNSYTGITNVGEGPLRLENSSALGTTLQVHVFDGAALEVNDEITLARPLIASGSGILNTGALRSVGGENVWAGQVTMEDDLTIGVDSDSTLTVSGAISDNLQSFALTKVGAGTLVLGNAANTYLGGTVVNGGTVSIGLNAALGAPGGAVVLNNGGKLQVTASTTTGRTFNLNTGSIQVQSGATLSYNGATVTGGFLRGPGTHAIAGPASFIGVTALSGNNIVQNAATTLINFTNSGSLTSNALLNWDGGYNTSAGAIVVNGLFNITAFENNGLITINSGGNLSNSDNKFTSGGGSRINVNSGGQINLNGTQMDLTGGLLVNNGTINGTLNVFFGSLAKGSGTYGPVNVLDGGRFSPGNSPGSVTTGSVTWGAGGNYTVEIADALGGAGVGWDLWNIDGRLLIDPLFSIRLTSLAGDANGPAAHFDASQDYQWLIASFDNGLGLTDLDEVELDAEGFANPIGNGHFFLTSSDNGLYVNFSSVPEPLLPSLLLPASLLLRRRYRCSRF